jgi:PAS domain-containing protein
LDWGAVIIPPLDNGVLRRLATTVAVDGGPVPTLAYAAARQAGAPDLPPPGVSFLLRFPHDLESLPRVDAQRVLDGRVPRELVEGRGAVVALAGDPDAPGLPTPGASALPTLRLPELRALALETLLSGRAVLEAGPAQSVALVLLAAAGGAAVYLRVGPRRWPFAAATATAGILAAGFGALRWAGLVLPVSALLASQVLLAFAIWRWREVGEDAALKRMCRELSAQLRGIAAPAMPYGTDEARWAAVAATASRLLGLRRSLFLVARAAGAPGLDQAAGIGASLADLPPDRRDPSRPPFSIAAGEGAPVAVERSFLASAGEGEEVYLAPLPRRGGAPRAFWAFTLGREEERRAPALLAAVRATAEEVMAPEEQAVPGLGGKRVDMALWRDVDRLIHHAVTLAGVLDRISTAVAVFDSLGRPLHVNARMAAATEAVGLRLGDLAPSDLAAMLGGLPQDQAARLVRRVLLERSPVELPAARPLGGRRYLLRLVVPGTGDAAVAAAPALLCELVDVTEPLRLAEIQRGFAEHVGLKLRNEVEAIQLAAGLLGDDRTAVAVRSRVLALMRGALESMRATVAAAEGFMAFEVGAPGLNAYPVDALAALRAAAADAEREASRRRARLDVSSPEIASLVLAAPGALEAVLRSMLLLLVEDAREGSVVAVAMEEGAAAIVVRGVNEGFGMPDARLQAVLAGEEAASSPEVGALREAVRTAAGWGGALTAEAKPGEGFRLALTLRRLF